MTVLQRSRATPVQWLARALMVVLWASGSAYLMAHALAQVQPSWIEIVVTPIVWAAVIAAPIVAHQALRHRDLLAAMLLLVASVFGSAWTLSGTITRQSEGADERVRVTAQVERQRQDLTHKLGEAQEILAKYRKVLAQECASGVGKRCDGMAYTVQTWGAAVDGYEAKLKALPLPYAPESGPKHIAALFALLPGVTKPVADIEAKVQVIAPTLLGLFIELAALAFGIFGFRHIEGPVMAVPTELPTAPTPTLEPVVDSIAAIASPAEPIGQVGELTDRSPAPRRKVTKTRAELRVAALRRPVSQESLARRWGVTSAAVSQWVSDWEQRGVVTRVRRGHCKLVRPAARRSRSRRAA